LHFEKKISKLFSKRIIKIYINDNLKFISLFSFSEFEAFSTFIFVASDGIGPIIVIFFQKADKNIPMQLKYYQIYNMDFQK
jgi:hypothetical protein